MFEAQLCVLSQQLRPRHSQQPAHDPMPAQAACTVAAGLAGLEDLTGLAGLLGLAGRRRTPPSDLPWPAWPYARPAA